MPSLAVNRDLLHTGEKVWGFSCYLARNRNRLFLLLQNSVENSPFWVDQI